MHYKTEELYFYLKEGGNDALIKLHLASCAECKKKAAQAAKISDMFRSAMEGAPPLKPAPAMAKKPAAGRAVYLKPAFALSLAALLFCSGALIVKKLFLAKDAEKDVPAFVYETYSTICDFDYYKANYMDKTEMKPTGGKKNETF
jgi:hypothetical protein